MFKNIKWEIIVVQTLEIVPRIKGDYACKVHNKNSKSQER
jgi:hypothetical protein